MLDFLFLDPGYDVLDLLRGDSPFIQLDPRGIKRNIY
jgi:hypothetical protein